MSTERAIDLVQAELAAVADPEKAVPMAAYLKTDMPFYGVQKKGRTRVVRRLTAEFRPADRASYTATVVGLWELPHREEKYVALSYARAFDEWIDAESLRLFRRLVVEGAWWDLVDETAVKLVGRALLKQRSDVEGIIRPWITDADLWLRRTSLICQIGHKSATDTEFLADTCTANSEDSEFFIRKAIGWALREYAKTDPSWVRAYIATHRDHMSALSIREASKHL